jgi:hypothetical protein
MLTVDVPVVSVVKLTEGVAEIVKSGVGFGDVTVTVMVAWCTRLPMVPVTSRE